MEWGHINGAFTLVLMISFIGIWIWAFQKDRKRDFDEAANLPLQEEKTQSLNTRPEGKS